jgi:photosystem II stability/assembly factor-like uncharacterized protein
MRTHRFTMTARSVFVSTLLMFGWHVAECQWLSLGPPGGYQVNSLALQPGAPQIIYATTLRGGVFKSTNGGLNWGASNAGLGNLNVSEMATDATAPLTAYAGTQTAGVFKTTDGGATWSAVNTGLEGLNPPGYVPKLVMDGSGIAVYAGTFQGVFKTTDGGQTWVPANTGLTELKVMSLAADPHSPLTLFAGTRNGIFKTVNGGGVWTQVYTQVYQGITAIQVAPTATSTIYAGTWYTGPAPGGTVGGDGVLKSTDGGTTWASANDAQIRYRAIGGIVVDPRSASTVYAGSWGVYNDNAAVFRSLDGGATWTALKGGFTNPYVNKLIVDPQGVVYAGTGLQDYGGGVFKLVDNGGACATDATTLCLNAGRFQAKAVWQVPTQGTSGVGQAVSMTADTGYFWFFSANNVELVVKVVDGRAFNNKFWVFYGALSNVGYTITVTDMQTGVVKTYVNPQGQLASVADTAAF